MAYGGASRQRDNFGRIQKQATINLTKRLRKLVESIQNEVRDDIAEELLNKYKENVLASYGPRSSGSYDHPDNTFLDSIDVKIENEPGIGRDRIKIVIDGSRTYPPTMVYDKASKKLVPHVTTVKEVYEFLTEGTTGGGYYYFKGEDGKFHKSYNYPTPAHLFEQHTQLQMKGYIENIKNDIQKGKYSK